MRVTNPFIGLSPRGRGNLSTRRDATRPNRSIPAWAGVPVALASTGLFKQVYPRVGGGTEMMNLTDTADTGLSPRGRGNPHSLVLSQLRFSNCLRKRTIGLSCFVGSVVGGGGSDGQGQVRCAAGGGTTGRTPASDSGWETPGPSHRQGPGSPQERVDGWPAPQVAEALDVALGTVYRVKQRFTQEGLAGVLKDRPQANRHRKLDDRGEAHLIALACSPPPAGHDR